MFHHGDCSGPHPPVLPGDPERMSAAHPSGQKRPALEVGPHLRGGASPPRPTLTLQERVPLVKPDKAALEVPFSPGLAYHARVGYAMRAPPEARTAQPSLHAFFGGGGGLPKPALDPPLPAGVVLLRDFLTPDQQSALIDARDELHAATPAYIPSFIIFDRRAYSALYMISAGSKWEAETKTNQSSRQDWDGLPIRPVRPVPPLVLSLATAAITEALRRRPGAFTAPPPDALTVALFNTYAPVWGGVGAHKDHSESRESIAAGYPVVSFSVGDAADFVMRPGALDQVVVQLRSGDALLFGGASRGIEHAVPPAGKAPRVRPPGLPMVPGRLNITVRTL